MIGPLTSHPYETEKASFNNTKVVSPTKMENKAALLSLYLNKVNNPRIIGTAIEANLMGASASQQQYHITAKIYLQAR